MDFTGLNRDFVNWFKSLYGEDAVLDQGTLQKMHLAFLSGHTYGFKLGQRLGFQEGYDKGEKDGRFCEQMGI
jgi:hypothetical protein